MMMKMKHKILFLLTVTLVASVLTGCPASLKTRSEAKEDEASAEGPSDPEPAKVQEVKPQGEYVIDEIKSEFTRLAGRVEDLERSKAQAAQQQNAGTKEELKKLETRIIELEQAQAAMLEALKKLETSVPAPDNKEAFEQGKSLLKAGKPDEAIESLNVYLKNPNGKHVEEATFLRGDAFYETKQFKKAIIDYSKFPEKFTKSRKLPQALYKIGQSFEALGMKDDAKGFYVELVEKFPKSSEAKKAKSKIK